MRNIRLIFVALLATLACLGQSSTGGGAVQGTVKDATVAAIPGAKVTITHADSSVATKTVANQDGFFATPPIQIGKYKVRVEHEGMRAWEGDLQLETGRTAEVSPVLTVGQVSETILVTETVPLVTT